MYITLAIVITELFFGFLTFFLDNNFTLYLSTFKCRDRSIARAAFLLVITLLLEYCSISLPNLKRVEKIKLKQKKTILLSFLILFVKMNLEENDYFEDEVEKHWGMILFCDQSLSSIYFSYSFIGQNLSKFSRRQLCN